MYILNWRYCIVNINEREVDVKMKAKKGTIFLLLGLLTVLLTGCFLVILLNVTGKDTEETETPNLAMFSAYTDHELYQEIPALVTGTSKIGKVVDHGKKNFILDVTGTTVDDYKAYLSTVEKAGFKKHSDNGEDAMEGNVYLTTFTKDNLVLTVTQVVNLDKTMVSVSQDLPLSEHLTYKEEYVKDNVEGAKTKIHLFQLNDNGTCFIIQLKNGHFVLHDSATNKDAKYLVEYLEELTPGDEKPVIEGWFISHGHGDHTGGLKTIAIDSLLSKRLIVNGGYFVQPSTQLLLTLGMADEGTVRSAFRSFRTENGDRTETYRTQFGQRYYFNDIMIDVSMTCEMFGADTVYNADYNETSSFYMNYIDGQKFFTTGDGSHTGMRLLMGIFPEEYFDVEVFAVSHHGINTYNYFTDYCTVDTALFTSFRMGSLYTSPNLKSSRIEETAYLLENVKEAYHHGDGTVVLTFPYKVGTAETLPMSDWRYNMKNPGSPDRSEWGE